MEWHNITVACHENPHHDPGPASQVNLCCYIHVSPSLDRRDQMLKNVLGGCRASHEMFVLPSAPAGSRKQREMAGVTTPECKVTRGCPGWWCMFGARGLTSPLGERTAGGGWGGGGGERDQWKKSRFIFRHLKVKCLVLWGFHRHEYKMCTKIK